MAEKTYCDGKERPHVIPASERERVKKKGGTGGVTCSRCGKRLMLKPSGGSVKGEVESKSRDGG